MSGVKWYRVRYKRTRVDVRWLFNAWRRGDLIVAWRDEDSEHHLIDWRDFLFDLQARDEILLLGWFRRPGPRLCNVYVARRHRARESPGSGQRVLLPTPPQPQPSKDKGGRPDDWDWEDLLDMLKQESRPFETWSKFEEWCRNNVKRVDRKKPRGDGPGIRAVRNAIHKYRLAEFAEILKWP
jgi:hypothetical protein